MDRRLVLMGMGATALTLGGVAVTGSFPRLLPYGAAQAQDSEAGPVVTDMVLGDPNAPVELIEYASFTCPHCASFHANVMPQLKENYIETGQVRLVYREVYFDRPGLWAGLVARCAGDMRYFGVVDMLYENQREWVQGDPATIAGNLRRIGLSVGLTNEELDACFSDADMAQAMITHYEANMEEYPVQGTPSFIVDGELYSNMNYDSFAEILDARLAAQ